MLASGTSTTLPGRNVMAAKTIWNIDQAKEESKVIQPISVFQGKGFLLRKENTKPFSDMDPNAVVRKLPGLGFIVPERSKKIIIGRSTIDKKQKKRKEEYITDSSDEEFDSTLQKLSAKKKKAKEM